MRIPFEENYREQYFSLLNDVFDSGFLSEGKMLKEFEAVYSDFTGLGAVGVASGGAALGALYEYVDVRGKDVIVPANTFWATTSMAIRAGANIIYADCNRDDLCLSLDDVKRKVTDNTKAVVLTHIGGHIAFEIEAIADFCKANDLALIEDCAHAHGASYNGKTAGAWGVGGAYSFYSTKTLPLGEGGMVVSADEEFLDWLRYYRNYGKQVKDGKVGYAMANGTNVRMNEVTAAFALVQMRRLPEILRWKRAVAAKFDQIFERRVVMPEGMESGYYKYIVFDYELKQQTGKVFNRTDFGNVIQGVDVDLPNAEWIAAHHACAPIWYSWDGADCSLDEIRQMVLGDA